MSDLFFRPENAWVGDLIPYYEDGIYYGFYLHDPRCYENQYAEKTTWHLITTRDFVHLDYHGEAIRRGTDDQPNKNAYTGSVIKDKNGIYHAFYTAYNADIKIDGRSVQSVMQATGRDLYHLTTDEDFLFVADDNIYESFDWRDPYVFWNEGEECYYMLLAARMKGSGALRGGCIALCKSEDLYHWSYEEPFYDPHMYVTMECPEVFRMGDWYYLVYSTFSDRFMTHYRMSRELKGPWHIPKNDTFDSRANYAIKTAGDGKKRYAFGWIPSKKGNCDFGSWEWGGTMDFHEIRQDEKTGTLTVRPTEAEEHYYDVELPLSEESLYYAEVRKLVEGLELSAASLGAVLYDIPEDCFSIELDMEVQEAVEFGVAMHVDEGLEKGYFLRMDPRTSTAAWDMWPRCNPGIYQWQVDGDKPFQIETSRFLPEGSRYHLLIIRENDICVVYINDKIAMSMRMYDHKGGKGGIYVIQGTVTVNNFSIKVREK